MDRNSPCRILFLCCLLSFLNTAYAGTISFVLENDAFAYRDDRYTSGIRLGWLSDELQNNTTDGFQNTYGDLMQSAVEAIPFLTLDDQRDHHAGMSIYQMTFTPQDIKNTEPDYNDIPYAGYLTSSFFFIEWDEKSSDEYRFLLGLVGPNSGAGSIQKATHKILGNNYPEGWDNQLGNHLTVGIAYSHAEKSWKGSYDNGLDADWVNSLNLQLGNFYTGVSGGTVWRFGKNYPENFNVYYPGIMVENALISLKRDDTNLGWSFSAGLFADAIGYLYTIDSAKDYNIDKEIFSGSAVSSLSLYFSNTEISYSMRVRTPLIKQSSHTMVFGALSILWHF
jgi:lipid A 3-O-deacylase